MEPGQLNPPDLEDDFRIWFLRAVMAREHAESLLQELAVRRQYILPYFIDEEKH
jgi:hypothetical protein